MERQPPLGYQLPAGEGRIPSQGEAAAPRLDSDPDSAWGFPAELCQAHSQDRGCPGYVCAGIRGNGAAGTSLSQILAREQEESTQQPHRHPEACLRQEDSSIEMSKSQGAPRS